MNRIRAMSMAGAATLALGVGPSASAADLVGTVNADYFFPNDSSVFSSSLLTVGTTLNCPADGGICTALASPASFLATGTSITLSQEAGFSYTNTAFNGIEFSGLTFDDGSFLTGFTLETNLSGLTASDISFTNDSIQYNVAGLSFVDAPYFITLNLSTSSAVPEPATWALLLLGFFGVGGMMRLQRRRQTITVSYA